MDAQRFCARKFDTLNTRARRQPCNILRIGAALDAFTQIIGNVLCNHFIGQHATADPALEPDDVEEGGLSPGSVLISPGASARSARSNSGVVCPLVIWPRFRLLRRRTF